MESSSYHTADYQQPFEVPSLDSPAQTIQANASVSSPFQGPRFERPSSDHTSETDPVSALLDIQGLDGPQTIRPKRLLYHRLLRSQVRTVLLIPYGPLSAPFEVLGLDDPAQAIQAKLILYHRLLRSQVVMSSPNHTGETASVSSPFEVPGSNGPPQIIRPKLILYQRFQRSQVWTILLKPYNRLSAPFGVPGLDGLRETIWLNRRVYISSV